MTVSRSTDTPELVHSSFAHVLHADGPDKERAKELALFAWLVGRWDVDITTTPEDGTTHHGKGEIHAGRATDDRDWRREVDIIARRVAPRV
jgi:hypothetical protein